MSTTTIRLPHGTLIRAKSGKFPFEPAYSCFNPSDLHRHVVWNELQEEAEKQKAGERSPRRHGPGFGLGVFMALWENQELIPVTLLSELPRLAFLSDRLRARGGSTFALATLWTGQALSYEIFPCEVHMDPTWFRIRPDLRHFSQRKHFL